MSGRGLGSDQATAEGERKPPDRQDGEGRGPRDVRPVGYPDPAWVSHFGTT